jgi:hypothetical protein
VGKVYIKGVTEGGGRETEEIFKPLMTEHFLKLIITGTNYKSRKPREHQAGYTLLNNNKNTKPVHIIFKLQKLQD